MTDAPQSPMPPEPPMSANAPNRTCRRGNRSHGGRKAFLILALIGSFFAGGFFLSHMHAFSEDGPAWTHHADGMTGPFGHHPGGPPPMSPEQRLAHARDMVDHALTDVSATADQKTKVLAIFDTTTASMKSLPVKMFTTRLEIATLLTAPTIDHAKLEALRTASVADVEATSKTIVQAVADAGDVLSQDQRTQLVMRLAHMDHRPPPPPHN